MAIGPKQLKWLMGQLRALGNVAGRYPGATAGVVTGATVGAGVGVRKRNQRRWSRELRSGMYVGQPTGVLKRYQRY